MRIERVEMGRWAGEKGATKLQAINTTVGCYRRCLVFVARSPRAPSPTAIEGLSILGRKDKAKTNAKGGREGGEGNKESLGTSDCDGGL